MNHAREQRVLTRGTLESRTYQSVKRFKTLIAIPSCSPAHLRDVEQTEVIDGQLEGANSGAVGHLAECGTRRASKGGDGAPRERYKSVCAPREWATAGRAPESPTGTFPLRCVLEFREVRC